LTQAIAKAGGIAPEAKTSKITIQRQGADGIAKTETVYDLKEIVAKKIDDPILQGNDIINVPKDSIKSVRNGFIKAITNGLPNVFLRTPLP
jgi:protein involved in polysaccharide export with SLBB domain